VRYEVGARWWTDLKECRRIRSNAGTESCLSRPRIIRMEDGAEELFEAGDVMMLPPGHDAGALGDEPCGFYEFSCGNDYYDPLAEALRP